mmetsp:Transcript_34736/g.79659  ORF Transcript_34736/g.79659 Transcript_34736/m.79659 type:complete len:805 (+) Transcript_34736:53-2467(+)
MEWSQGTTGGVPCFSHTVLLRPKRFQAAIEQLTHEFDQLHQENRLLSHRLQNVQDIEAPRRKEEEFLLAGEHASPLPAQVPGMLRDSEEEVPEPPREAPPALPRNSTGVEDAPRVQKKRTEEVDHEGSLTLRCAGEASMGSRYSTRPTIMSIFSPARPTEMGLHGTESSGAHYIPRDARSQWHQGPLIDEFVSSKRVNVAASINGEDKPVERNSRPFTQRFLQSEPRVNLSEEDAKRLGGLRDLYSTTWVINPDSNRTLAKWDMLMVLALGFVAVFTPMEVSLMEVRYDAVFIVNRFVDVVFMIDMALNFFTAFPVYTRFGRTLEFRRKKIARNYLTGWFIVDFLSILPFDIYSLAIQDSRGSTLLSGIKLVKVVRLLRLLKLLRVLKSSRIFRRIEISFAMTYQNINLAKFFCLLMLIGHWMACVWAMTLKLVDADENVPRWVDTLEPLESEPYSVSPMTRDSSTKIYLTSAYVASYTITGIGDGDIPPKNASERLIKVVMEYAAGIIWAYVIGQVCSIIYRMDSAENEFRNIMDDLNYMMEDRSLPMVLRRRLRGFFLAAKQARRHENQRSLLKKMSPALQGEVAFCSNEKWLLELSFFKGLDIAPDPSDPLSQAPKVIVDIATALEVMMYSQMERFGAEGTLYIQKAGLTSRLGRIYRSGAVWGIDFVLSDRELVHPLTSFCLTYVECTTLFRDTFLQIVKEHEAAFPQLARNVRKHIVNLAVRRGIVNEGRRRRAAEAKARRMNGTHSATLENKENKAARNRATREGMDRIVNTWSCADAGTLHTSAKAPVTFQTTLNGA